MTLVKKVFVANLFDELNRAYEYTGKIAKVGELDFLINGPDFNYAGDDPVDFIIRLTPMSATAIALIPYGSGAAVDFISYPLYKFGPTLDQLKAEGWSEITAPRP